MILDTWIYYLGEGREVWGYSRSWQIFSKRLDSKYWGVCKSDGLCNDSHLCCGSKKKQLCSTLGVAVFHLNFT